MVFRQNSTPDSQTSWQQIEREENSPIFFSYPSLDVLGHRVRFQEILKP